MASPTSAYGLQDSGYRNFNVSMSKKIQIPLPCEVRFNIILQHLIDSRRTHAATDAHRNDPSFRLPSFHLMEELRG